MAGGVDKMKLLRVKANHFKNCSDEFEIDFVARSKKTSEDKEYELQEIADELYVHNTIAVVGKMLLEKLQQLSFLMPAFLFLVISDWRQNLIVLIM